MKIVRIVALRKDRKRLLEHLQDSALVQIKKTDKARDGFERVDMTSHMQVFERDVTLTEQALKILDGVSPEKSGMLSSFKGRREVDPDEIGVIASKSGEVISVCKRIVELDKRRADNKAEQARIATQLVSLEAWQKLDIPLNTSGTRSTAIFVGTFPDCRGKPAAGIRAGGRTQRAADDLRGGVRSRQPEDDGGGRAENTGLCPSDGRNQQGA